MSSNKLRVVALFKAQPSKQEEVIYLLKQLIAATVKEKGCVFYELHQNLKDKTDITFIEEWESEEDLNLHLESAHIKEIIPQVLPLLETPPDVRRYQLLQS